MVKFIIFSLFFFSIFLQANVIKVDHTENFQDILSHSKIFIDQTKSMSIEEIIKQKDDFKQNESARLSFGYSPNFHVWLQVTLQNTTNKPLRKVIEYANPLTTHIDFFDPQSDLHHKDGLFQINKHRKTINPYFIVSLQAHEQKTFYLKVRSHITTMIIELKLWDQIEFFNKEFIHQSILQLFFGAMFILAIYNLFIYFFTRDISYLFYVIYIIGVIIHQLAYTGIFDIYLLSQEAIFTTVNYAAIISSLPILMLAFFIKSFLQINNHKNLNTTLDILVLFSIISMIVFSITDSVNNYRNLPAMLLVLYLIYITIYMSLKGNRQAYFILVGWLFIGSATLFMYLSSTGIFNIFQYLPYYIEFAFLSEALLFSIALADKINHLQTERNTINEALIKQKETEKKRLSTEVKKKTKELKTALDQQTTLLKELNHRVKNNMQTILSLISLQANEIEDNNIMDMFLTTQNRIRAMTYLHELLYKQSDISHINSHEYFDTVVDNLQSSFEQDVAIHYNISVDLDIETATTCGLILNELLMNSFKHAFTKQENPKINIELFKEKNLYHFNISDNGEGYETNSTYNSFGLVLVSTLVEDHLDGTLHIDSTNGVSNQITWEEHEENQDTYSGRPSTHSS